MLADRPSAHSAVVLDQVDTGHERNHLQAAEGPRQHQFEHAFQFPKLLAVKNTAAPNADSFVLAGNAPAARLREIQSTAVGKPQQVATQKSRPEEGRFSDATEKRDGLMAGQRLTMR